jgi:PAS domain S-box-containing protein
MDRLQGATALEREPASTEAVAPGGDPFVGAMADRVRAFDWSRTPLGPAVGWPQSLRTAVDICLSSRFPMTVWWGPDLTFVHNDAYGPILGKRHPAALGRPAAEVWADVWPVIGPQVESVLGGGEPTWTERPLVVVERNGFAEDGWFTWSFSPLRDEAGGIAGVLLMVVEDTSRVLAERDRDRLAERRQQKLADARARAILESVTDGFFALDRDWRFTYANLEAGRILGRPAGELVGRVIWDEYPGLIGSDFEAMYRSAMTERVGGSVTQFYPDHNRWYEAHSHPLPDGVSIYFRDVTARERAQRDRERFERERDQFVRTINAERTNLAAIIERAPAFICTLRGPTHVFELANERYYQVVGRRNIVGRTVRDALPEVEGQGFFELLDHVYRTGETFAGNEMPALLEREGGGPPDLRFMNLVYQATREADGAISGIFVHGVDVTDLVRSRDAVEASEAQRRLALDAADLGSFNMDGESGALRTDARLRAIFGIPEDAPDFERVLAAVHPDDRAGVLAAVAATTGRPDDPAPYAIEHRVVHPDGSTRWVAARGRASVERAGQARRLRSFDGTVADVTDRKRAEIAARDMADRLERQSRLFERIASSTPDLIYVFDLDGRVVYANRRLLEIWGLPFEQAVGRSLPELGYPDWHAAMHLRELRQVIDTRQPIRGEVPFTGASGISGFYEYIFTPVLGPDGGVEAIAGTTRDVTERRATEGRMARDGMLLANVRDSVVVTDLGGVVTFWNAGATRMFGWAAEEMLGRPYADRLPEPFRAEVAGWIGRIAAGGAEFEGEWLDHRKDGSRVWIESHTRLITDAAGRSLGIMGVSRDVSERKRAEAEREQLLASERAARAEAERASRMKDEFLATLSHELRTPLNAILGWAQIMRGGRGDADDDDVAQGAEVIERNARAQSQIIEDLLDMSRIIGGKVRLDVQRLDLAAIVTAAVETARPTADAKGVRLVSVVDPLHGVAVSGDPGRVQQVLWNLLSNAVKFTPRGGRVQVVLERVNSHLEICVSDTGEGIRPDFLPFVFDRFRQADASTTRRHGGLGLGLSIVKQLVELHGGSVAVRSAGPGQGSTFVVSLPVTVVHPGARSEEGRRHPRAAPHRAGAPDGCMEIAGLRVVVVDDEADARALVKRLLEDCHAVVADTGSADEAVGLVATGAFDVLVSDIGMPGEDGYSLIRRVRSLGKDKGGDIPAIALTAYARVEDRVRAVTAGFQMHVAKPVEAVELITMVAGAAGRTGRA